MMTAASMFTMEMLTAARAEIHLLLNQNFPAKAALYTHSAPNAARGARSTMEGQKPGTPRSGLDLPADVLRVTEIPQSFQEHVDIELDGGELFTIPRSP